MTRGGVPFIELETGEGEVGLQSHRAWTVQDETALRANTGHGDRTR